MNRATTCLLLSVVAVSSAVAEEGRIPIFEPTFLNAATAPIGGKYIVTRDISLGTNGNILGFVGSGSEVVEIDLNGFTLSFADSAQGSGIVVRDFRKFTVRNGTIIGGDGQNSTGITVSSPGGIAALAVTVEDVALETFVANGISINDTEQFAVRRCFVRDIENYGINIANSDSGVIVDNLLRDTGNAIRAVVGINGLTVRGNRIFGTTDIGVYLGSGSGGLEVRENDIQQAGGTGLWIKEGKSCLVAENLVESSGLVITGSHGIWIQQATCLILNNISTDNDGAGLRVESTGNRIQGNVLNNNRGTGLFLNFTTNDCSYGDNAAVGNTGACSGSAPAGCATPDICDIGTGNTSMGANFFGTGPC